MTATKKGTLIIIGGHERYDGDVRLHVLGKGDSFHMGERLPVGCEEPEKA